MSISRLSDVATIRMVALGVVVDRTQADQGPRGWWILPIVLHHFSVTFVGATIPEQIWPCGAFLSSSLGLSANFRVASVKRTYLTDAQELTAARHEANRRYLSPGS